MAKNLSKKSSQKAGRNPKLSSLDPTLGKSETCEQAAQYLKGVKAVIIEQGLGKTRASILSKQLARHGGEETTKINQDTTHVLVGNSIKFAKLAGILKVKEISDKVKVLRADWLSTCLKEGKIVDLKPFSLRENDTVHITVQSKTESTSDKTQGKRSIDVLDELPCTDDKDCKDSDVLGNIDMPTTSNNGAGSKRRKVTGDDGDSDYIDSDDTEEEGTSGDDGGKTKPTEISPHISPHKKVER